MSSDKNRQRLILTALILVFLMPFAAAWFIYNFSDFGKSDKGGNYGELIVPPVSMPDLKLLDPLAGENNHNLRGKWNLLYVLAGDCTLECRRSLDMMLGLRTVLQNDAGRIQIVVATPAAGIAKGLSEYLQNHAGKTILVFPSLDNTGSPERGLSPPKEGILEQGKFYIIDPLGNLIMSYSANSEAEGLIRDLKRLLRYSRIG